jgi:hypothetical protein
MTLESDIIDIKLGVAAMLDQLIREAVEQGTTPSKDLYRRLSVETLELAARMHDGTDASFLAMARQMILLVRTGQIEQ